MYTLVHNATCQALLKLGYRFQKRKFLKGFYHIWHGGHLGHVTWIIYVYIDSPSYRCFKSNLALIGQAISEKIFKYHCDIHVYCPGVGSNQPLGSKFFQNHKTSVHLPISFKFLSNDILTIFPIQMHGPPMLTLP